MRVEIVSTGTELLLGEILNSNFQYLAEQLNALGFDVLYESTVGDNWNRMKSVIKAAKERTEIVITIGGLGPTQGDITKEVTAELLERELLLDKNIEIALEKYFLSRKLPMAKANVKQAYLPKGAVVLENDRGTAPGIWVEHEEGIVINLPGPPHELKYMFDNKVKPLLLQKYGSQGVIHSRTLRSVGIGESIIAERLQDIIKNQTNPTIALYARDAEMLIRLTAKAESVEQADTLINELAIEVQRRIESIYGANEDSLPVVLGKMLKKHDFKIAFAESCTGGLAGNIVTDIPGSSDYFLGSIVSYSNKSKTDILKVNIADIDKYGAVSEQVAQQMAQGVAKLLTADIGVGITGIAGPDGGSHEKPVGTVYISVYFDNKLTTYKHRFTGERKNIKLRTAKMSIFSVLQTIQKMKGSF